ncbi:cupredoxin domain-containing protein [Methylobacterium sp. E-065]|uniref:cupredoxin domain-containing protein n=1 Tax=Methylobacterium sp. E-065 TaxID=2836583 RepID=UPI001FBB4A8D|nr:cupredoxin domain-containing protein [Methylobacterium sp. E-065]MCJ2020716.1 cupredoxin domain-containing protein [Methylobacterium sp. E-065]
MSRPLRAAALVALLLAASAAASVRADDMPVIKVEMRDGVILPAVIEVPANTRFKLEISNTGQSPVEFESAELKREKALAAGSTSAIVFRTLDPGTYQVFDDFHPDAKATLVAK